MSKVCEPHKRIDLDDPKMDWVVDQLFKEPNELDGNSFDIWVGPEE
ncbi:hypothetical protein [Furfurilactobacillus siliginis]|uniref:Uncharacterized protein n=1 Tax=Furfurilactobacillus siliginis TaxID=348151 RepID=A0A510VR67_9LACO|nr:hypothetical protein [Furfurilactobacillus siliginis]GEK29444.1 hypothetical protein LSI01_17550 [Furfurilactobacillus siliginis]